MRIPLGSRWRLSATQVGAKPQAADETAIVVVSSLGHTLCHVGELLITGTILAVMAEFDLEPFYAVMLPWLGYILMGLGALPSGYGSDVWGPARLLRIYFAALAVAGVAVALSPNVLWLFAALTLLGMATSIYHPVGLAMISLGVRDRGRAMGINGVAGSLGVATGPALGMLAVSFGAWRLAFVALTVCALAALVLMQVWMPRELPVFGRSGAGEESTAEPKVSAAARRLRYLALALFMAAMMLGGFNYRCLVTALPPFLTGQAPGAADMAKGSLFIWVALLVGGIGQYLGSWMASGHRAWRVYLSIICALVPLAVLLGLTGGGATATWAACGLAVCLFGLQPIENIILADWTTVGRRSLSYATKFAFTFGMGALGTPAVGLIWRELGALGPAFYLLAVSAALMAALALAAIRVRGLAQRA